MKHVQTSLKTEFKESLKREIPDLILLSCLSILVPIVWTSLGWGPNLSAMGNDAIKAIFPFSQTLADHGGDWSSVLYRPELLGGFIVHNISGTLPLLRFFSLVTQDPLWALNLTAFATQILFGFVFTRICNALIQIYKSDSDQEILKFHLESVLTGVFFAFLPVFGWRLIYGHLNIIFGAQLFFVALALALAALTERMTLVLLVVSWISCIQGFQDHGYQIVLYSVLFAGPIAVAALFPLKKPETPHRYLPALMIPISAALYSLPPLAGMLHHSFTSDATRTISDAPSIYTWVTQSAQDWIGSIPWSTAWVPTNQDPFKVHETHYAFGPLLPIAIFFLQSTKRKKKFWIVAATVTLSFVAAVFLASNVEPFSGWMLKTLPVLGNFRVPGRSLYLFSLFISVVGCVFIRAQFSSPLRIPARTSTRIAFIGMALGLILILANPRYGELVCWTLALAMIGMVTKKKTFGIPASSLLLLITASAISSFGERLLPMETKDELVGKTDTVGNFFRKSVPKLQSALTRAQVDVIYSPLSLNAPYASRISTLNGYWAPPLRFMQLKAILDPKPTSLLNAFIILDLSQPQFHPLRHLYNVPYRIRGQGNDLQAFSLGPTLGEAWFSNSIQSVSSFSELGQLLSKATTDEEFMALQRQAAYVISSEDLPITASSTTECSTGKVKEVRAAHDSQEVFLDVESPGTCPLTISMNYVEFLKVRGYAQTNLEAIDLKAFPVYGALLGTLVPKEVTRIGIHAEPWLPLWCRALHIVWLLPLGISIFSIRRRSKTDAHMNLKSTG